ncbi:MAG: response regulator [Candidatus Nitronauta litoralis]|uniref:Response regulator n=1 Tax=Candidatus Nitronauta litoralis TaxID=2705533 RepID=A0A7T0FZN7_9BACT|nr:MAG: response regulator [Candidatus Nitronauta litoralis]
MENGIQNWKVLVADNSTVMGRLIKNYLVEMGLKGENITITEDGNQASMMAGLMAFDLVTAGRHMKVKDGLELLTELRANPDESISKVKFLMITADGSAQLLADVLSAGADGLLSKPFHPKDFSETLERLNSGSNGFVCLSENERYRDSSQKKEESAGPEEETDGIPARLVDIFVKNTIEGLGQYMVQAQPGNPCEKEEVKGDLVSSIELLDSKSGIKFHLTLLFPKKSACTIYETLFGEVDMDMVCGIVGELNNIIGGAVKPHLAEMANVCHLLLRPEGDPLVEGTELEFQLGFPDSKWLEAGEIGLPENTGHNFMVPFQLDDGKLFLSVTLQTA